MSNRSVIGSNRRDTGFISHIGLRFLLWFYFFYFFFVVVFFISTPRKRRRVHREMNKTYYYIKYNSYILNIYHDIWYAIYFLLYFQASDLRIVIAAFSESAARQVFCEVCFGLQKVFFSN